MPSDHEDVDYLKNYLPDTLYVIPGRDGAYAKMVAENEVCLGEIDVTLRTRLAVSGFYVSGKSDFGSFKITKLKFTKAKDWHEDGHVLINHFDLAKMKDYLSILTSIDLREPEKTRVSLTGNIQISELGALLNSTIGPDFLSKLSASPELQNDIYAVAAKRAALAEFTSNLGAGLDENYWQKFFERNKWIFGHGLNFVFLDSVLPTLEAQTTGSDYRSSGKIVDGLLRTRAEVSQYVLAEIKTPSTALLKASEYRSGCWAVSNELSAAVTQIQKTVYEFAHGRFHDRLKDALGRDLPEEVFAVDPQSFLIIGNMNEIYGHDDKIKCFELYRKNVRSPTILTFDELYYRAKRIVENLSEANRSEETRDDGEIPF